MEYYSVIKRSEILIHATPWIILENYRNRKQIRVWEWLRGDDNGGYITLYIVKIHRAVYHEE